MDKKEIEEVIKILEKERKLYQQVYGLANKKQEAIVEEDLESLEEIIEQEVDYMDKINKLDQRREDIAGEQSIEELEEQAEGTNAERLTKLQEKLTELLTKLDDLNRTNDKLLQDALQLVNLELNALQGKDKPGTYGKQGTVNNGDGQESSVLDHKA